MEHTVRTLKGLIEPDSDDTLAEGSGEEGSDEGSDNDVVPRMGHVGQRGGHAVSENKDVKREDCVASPDENVQIERIGVNTGNQLIDQFESVYFGAAYSFLLISLSYRELFLSF